MRITIGGDRINHQERWQQEEQTSPPSSTCFNNVISTKMADVAQQM
jgi:hypothetical protein